jgi:putative transposase
MEQAHMAIAAWFDVYSQRPQRGHMEGACPLDVFLYGKGPGVDAAGLHYMMMSQEVRHINRNGIHFLGQNYYDPELYGRRHGVTIRYDLQDTSEIYVFDGEGEFLCKARPMEKCHPAANVLGDETHREQLVEHIKEKKRQERDASSLAVAFLEDHVLPEHKRMLENSGINGMGQPAKIETKPMPRPAIDHEKFEAEVAEITEANRVAKLELYPEEQETPINFMEEVIGSWNRLEELNMFTRYKHLGALEILGVMIPREQRDFMVYYESTDEYRRNEDRFEQHKMEMLTKYQMSEKIVELRERAAAGEANG